MSCLEGVKVGAMNINNIRYADGTLLIADTEKNYKDWWIDWMWNAEGVGLRSDTSKTEVMAVINKKEQSRANVNVGGEAEKQVRSLRYLGGLGREECSIPLSPTQIDTARR